MSKIHVDTSELPVFHLKFPAEITREDVDALGVYTAYTWLMGGPCLSKCFRTREEALAWSLELLRAAR